MIRVWNMDSSTPVRSFKYDVLFFLSTFSDPVLFDFRGHIKDVNQITCNAKKTLLASSSDDCTARIWSVADFTTSASEDDTTRLLQGHTQPVSGITWGHEPQDGEHDIIAT